MLINEKNVINVKYLNFIIFVFNKFNTRYVNYLDYAKDNKYLNWLGHFFYINWFTKPAGLIFRKVEKKKKNQISLFFSKSVSRPYHFWCETEKKRTKLSTKAKVKVIFRLVCGSNLTLLDNFGLKRVNLSIIYSRWRTQSFVLSFEPIFLTKLSVYLSFKRV